MPGRVLLHGGTAVAAPCHHSKDKPALRCRGRDQLRQAAFSPKANTRVAKRLGFHEVKANLEGDSGPPRDGREPSWARPCEASGALLLSNGGSGGGHETCTLWPPPAPFGYFPVWESTSSARRRTKPLTRNKFLAAGRKRAYLSFSRITKGFASAEATRGLSDRPLDPFGAHPFMRGRNLPQETDFLRKAKQKPFLLFHVSQIVLPLSYYQRFPLSVPLAPGYCSIRPYRVNSSRSETAAISGHQT